jgi:hypothetical protein
MGEYKMNNEFKKLNNIKLEEIQNKVNLRKNSDEYEIIEFYKHENKNKDKVVVKHNKCGIVKTINYSSLMKKDYKCSCEKGSRIVTKSKFDKEDLQKAIDNNFGKNIFTIIDLENGLYSKVTIKHNKCGSIFSYEGNNLIRLKEYNCECGEKIISPLNKNITPLNTLRKRLFEKSKGRIIYKRGYKSLSTPCIFFDNKCKREFEMIPRLLLRFNYLCPLCKDEEEKQKSIDLWQKRFDFYKINDIKNRKLYMECKTCHKEIVSSLMTKGNRMALCECEEKIKSKITNDLLNINLYGKTENLSEYLKENEEFLLESSLDSFTTYDVKKNMNDFILKEVDKIDEIKGGRVNDIIRDTLLMHPKVNFKFDDFVFTSKNKRFSFKLKSFTAIDVNKFNIRRIFNIVIERKNGEIYDFNFFIDDSHLIHITTENNYGTSNSYVNNSVGLCFKILLLFNKRYTYTNEIKDYESNSIITPSNKKNDKVNIVEYKELKLDLKKERVRIINKGHSTRKISCNFFVSGHFRHLESGKSTFIKRFEKGKEFKNIRRIEKNYIVK